MKECINRKTNTTDKRIDCKNLIKHLNGNVQCFQTLNWLLGLDVQNDRQCDDIKYICMFLKVPDYAIPSDQTV